MAIRWFLGGLLAGLAVFMWGAIAHMATPLGTMGMSVIDSAREEPVLAALKGAVPETGLYFIPGRDLNATPTPEQLSAWEAKLKAGPSGLLLVTMGGAEAMSPKQLLTELATCIVVSWLAGVLLLTTRLQGFASRVLFVAGVGLFSWLSISVPYWNWYGFPTAFTVALLIEEVVGCLVIGAVLAAVLRPAVAPVTIPVEDAAELVAV